MSDNNGRKDIASVMETVAKLITLANNEGATEAESKLAQKRAEQIMLKYNISQADVMSREIKEKGELSATRQDANCFYMGKFYNWEYRMGWGIAPIFDCKAVRNRGHWDNDLLDIVDVMSFVGMPNDVSLVLYFFDYIQNEIGTAMEIAYPRKMRLQNDFAMGMLERILIRLHKMYERIKQEMPQDCMALVVVKGDAVAKKYKEEFPNLGTARLSNPRFNNAYRNGRAAGDRVHLSSNLRQVK